MKKSTVVAVITVSIIALILSGVALYNFYYIRFQQCRNEYAHCSRQCRDDLNEALARTDLNRLLDDVLTRQALFDCGFGIIGDSAVQECRNEVNQRAEQTRAFRDLQDEQSRLAYERCKETCMNNAVACDIAWEERFTVNLPPGTVVVAGDEPFVVECLGTKEAPFCYKKVDPLCQRISGVCGKCWNSLCGGGGWELEAEGLAEVILVAAIDPWKNPRVLATSSLNGKKAVLNIPPDIKLNQGEQLYLGFKSDGSGKPLMVTANKLK